MKISRFASLQLIAASLIAASTFASLSMLCAQTAGAPKAPAPAAKPSPSFAYPSEAAISPDGKIVAWTLRRREGATLHLTAIADPDPAKERLIAPNGTVACSNDDPVWSPDGNTLAFTSTCTSKEEKPGQEQIFLWSKATGDIKQLTHVTGNFKQAAWAPDGKTIAFLFVKDATRSAGALDAMKPFAGVIGEDNIEIQGVCAVDVASGAGDWLVAPTPAMYTFEFAWSPNGKEVAFIASAAPGENNWWVAKLYTRTRGGELKVALDPTTVAGGLHNMQIAVPRWSPDGKQIAVIGGIMSDQGSTGGDVWVVNADGKGAPADVTPGIDGTPTYEAWLSNDKIGFVEARRGNIRLVDYDVHTMAMVPNSACDLGAVTIFGGQIKNAVSVSSNGIFAFIEMGLNSPPEVWAGPDDKFVQLTHLNDGAVSPTHTESVEWENEGFHVQGWLTFPANYDAKKKYPLIVEVHGGPSADTGPRFGMGGEWASQGYFEFQPNPRGSFGQGEKFAQANIKDFGYGDLRDILNGMDTLEAKYPIDTKREGLTGWSYGGFMTMFAVTQTKRFAAAVAGAGISDWESYYGENSIGEWMIPFFGASVYDDPAVYAKSSAITFIKNVAKTPMLIIVGDRDGECPAPQSFEMWAALKAEGVKTQLVVYPNEGHGFRDADHIRDRATREAKWFADNMPAH